MHINTCSKNAYRTLYFHHKYPPATKKEKSNLSLPFHLSLSPAMSNHILHLHSSKVPKVKKKKTMGYAALLWNQGSEEWVGKGRERKKLYHYLAAENKKVFGCKVK